MNSRQDDDPHKLETRVNSLENRVEKLEDAVEKSNVIIDTRMKSLEESLFGRPGQNSPSMAKDIAEIKKYAQTTNKVVNEHEAELRSLQTLCEDHFNRVSAPEVPVLNGIPTFRKGQLIGAGLVLIMGAGSVLWRFIDWVKTLNIGK